MELAKLSPLCCALALAGSGAVAMAQDSQSWLGVDLLVNEGSEMKVSDVQVMRVGGPFGSGIALPNDPNASYLYDNNRQDFWIQPGLNLAWGRWLDTDKRWGMEFSGLYLMEKKAKWSDSEAGGTGAHTCLITSIGPLPDDWLGYFGLHPFSDADGYGSIQITSHSRMWGLEASAVHNLVRDDSKAIDMVLGVKHLNLSEDFQISLNDTLNPSDYYRAKDRWETKNSILALKLAVRGRVNIGTNWKFTAEGSVALGMNRESVDVSGSGSISSGGATRAWDSGGVFTGPCNMGRKSRSKLVYIPEVKIGIEQKRSERISLTANAHVMYISDVIRPGEQVNRIISTTGTGFASQGHPDPAAPYPTRRFETNDYVSYGLTLGVKINF